MRAVHLSVPIDGAKAVIKIDRGECQDWEDMLDLAVEHDAIAHGPGGLIGILVQVEGDEPRFKMAPGTR